MPHHLVIPVVDATVRQLCQKPYPNHKCGCPNWNKKQGCPPNVPLLEGLIDLETAVFVIWNKFDFGNYISRMKSKHPTWSERQLACCLYWQGTARKELRKHIKFFLQCALPHQLVIVNTPEACGVNITATMKSIGFELEWPPKRWAYQVVLAGTAKEKE